MASLFFVPRRSLKIEVWFVIYLWHIGEQRVAQFGSREAHCLCWFWLILKSVAVMIRVDVISMTRMGLWTWIILYFAQNNRFTLSSGHEWTGTGPHLPHLSPLNPYPIRLVEVCRLFSLLTERMCVCVSPYPVDMLRVLVVNSGSKGGFCILVHKYTDSPGAPSSTITLFANW